MLRLNLNCDIWSVFNSSKERKAGVTSRFNSIGDKKILVVCMFFLFGSSIHKKTQGGKW